MIRAFLGKKLAQNRYFTDTGDNIAVTRILASPSTVMAVKTIDRHGYNAAQLGFDFKPQRKQTKPMRGITKKLGLGTIKPQFLREVKLAPDQNDSTKLKVGDQIVIDQVFEVGDVVKVTGISKGKGFQGVVKRHGFKGGPRTHGQSDRERAPGSIGQTTTPGRVYKGKRMAGRMGGRKVSVRGLKVIALDKDKQVLTLSGLVPGYINSYVIIERQLQGSRQ